MKKLAVRLYVKSISDSNYSRCCKVSSECSDHSESLLIKMGRSRKIGARSRLACDLPKLVIVKKNYTEL